MSSKLQNPDGCHLICNFVTWHGAHISASSMLAGRPLHGLHGPVCCLPRLWMEGSCTGGRDDLHAVQSAGSSAFGVEEVNSLFQLISSLLAHAVVFTAADQLEACNAPEMLKSLDPKSRSERAKIRIRKSIFPRIAKN